MEKQMLPRTHVTRWLGLAVLALIIFPGVWAYTGELEEWEGPGLRPAGQTSLWTGDSYMDSKYATGATLLHNIGITGRGVAAAVIDQTYDADHPAYRDQVLFEASAAISYVNPQEGLYPYNDQMKKVATYQLGDKEVDVYLGVGKDMVGVPNDPDFAGTRHGTHVVGTVAAMAPGAGLVLVNPAHWSDPTSRTREDLKHLYETVHSLEYVAVMAERYNIVAVNNSWGNVDFSHIDDYDEEYGLALRDLAAAGVAPVFATGNDAVNNLGVPSNYEGTVSVGATDTNGYVAEFSDQRDDIVIMAPGVGINSAVPFSDYATLNGTSMAAPHVTGAITLIASGARNASTLEIIQSIHDSADVFLYDGNEVIQPEQAYYAQVPDNYKAVFLRITGVDLNEAKIQDEWREVGRLNSILNRAVDDLDSRGITSSDPDFLDYLQERYDEILEENLLFPYYGPLGQVDFPFLRVDKAYMHLTRSRMEKRADAAAQFNSAVATMLRSFGNELGAGLNQDTAEIFQRLDAQDTVTLANAGRQISPQWSNSALEYGLLGTVGIHRAIGRRGERIRLCENHFLTAAPNAGNALANLDPAEDNRAELWLEGFGSFADRSGTIKVSDYDGHFVGVSLGVERKLCDWRIGVFGSWADFRASGSDGVADGDWYVMGLYGRYDRANYFLEGSAAYTYADYDSRRGIFIPGAIFSTPTPGELITKLPFDRRANTKNRVHGFSARLAAGMDLIEDSGWTLGARAEGSLSYGRVSGFREGGAGALDLLVDSYHSTYAEGGLGLALSKAFGGGGDSRFIASAKVMAMYGGAFGGSLTGRYSTFGSEFRFEPKRLSSIWCLPEASLTWKINHRVDVTASYAGRFGNRYSENTGSLNIGIGF